MSLLALKESGGDECTPFPGEGAYQQSAAPIECIFGVTARLPF